MLSAYYNNPIDKEQWLKKLYFEVSVYPLQDPKKFFQKMYSYYVRLSMCTQHQGVTTLDFHHTCKKYISQAILDALRHQYYVVRVVRDATDLTQAEGKRGRRPIQGQLSVRFVLISRIPTVIFQSYTVLPFLHDGKSETDFVCYWYRILGSGV